MAELTRIRRLVEGALPGGVELLPLTDEEVRQRSLRAVLKVYARDNPRAPLDRLSPQALAAFRARS